MAYVINSYLPKWKVFAGIKELKSNKLITVNKKDTTTPLSLQNYCIYKTLDESINSAS